jgi:hypothetical protein
VRMLIQSSVYSERFPLSRFWLTSQDENRIQKVSNSFLIIYFMILPQRNIRYSIMSRVKVVCVTYRRSLDWMIGFIDIWPLIPNMRGSRTVCIYVNPVIWLNSGIFLML